MADTDDRVPVHLSDNMPIVHLSDGYRDRPGALTRTLCGRAARGATRMSGLAELTSSGAGRCALCTDALLGRRPIVRPTTTEANGR